MFRYDVFLSHNSADKPTVEELARRLSDEAGLQPFLDKWHLVPGEPWQEAIEAALDQSRTCAVFIGPSGLGPWEHEEMRAAIEQRVAERSFRVIPVLLPGAERGERGRLPAFLTRTTWVEFRQGLDDADAFRRLVAGIRGVAPGRGPGEVAFTGECPYRGLQVFEAEHARFFFGREAATGWLVDGLRGDHFLAVIGPSGSGKSSLVRAGLVPALQDGALPGSDNWPLAVLKPGPRPLESLALALTQLAGPAADPEALPRLIDTLAADQRQLHLTARLALAEAPPDRYITLVVDQFEEIFTLCRDEGQRGAFIDNLLYASAIEGGRTVVVLTMRADFYGKCAAYPDLAARVTGQQMLVSPMLEEELRQAIERPAQSVGLEFEGGLVETLLRDVQAEPGALPLLQHALLELWERREGRRLTFAAYGEIGGIQGAIAHRAEAVFAGFDAGQQHITRRVMLRLTEPGEGTEDTRRRAPLQELMPAEGGPVEVEKVVGVLADARLLTTGRDERGGEMVDVAHEALIRGWPRLRNWIDEDRAALRTHRRLTDAAREWEEHGRDDSYLYRGARLAEAGEFAAAHAADLNPLEREFVESSLAAQRAREAVERRRLRWTITALAIGLILITILAVVATTFGVQSNQRADELGTALYDVDLARETAVAGENAAKIARGTAVAGEDEARAARETAVAGEDNARQSQAEAEFQARLALARQLANQAAFYRANDPQLALLLAINAVSTTHRIDGYTTWEAGAALRGLMGSSYQLVATSSGHTDAVWHAAWSGDGTRILTAGQDGTAKVWDAASGRELLTLSGHAGWIRYAAWSGDGARILTASGDGTARVWDAASGRELFTLSGHTGFVWHATWSGDGARILTASEDGTAGVWDAASGRELLTLSGHTGAVLHATWSGDGARILTASEDGTAKVWDAASGRELFTLSGHAGWIRHATWSGDGARILTAGQDRTARVWDAASGWELLTLRGHSGPVLHATWSGDGARILTAGQDGTAKVWDAASGRELLTLRGHSGPVRHAAWSGDGARILTASEDGTAGVWDAASGRELLTLSGHSGPVLHATWSGDGARILTAGQDGTAKVWDAASGRELLTLRGHSGPVRHATWSGDGARILTASQDGTARVWDAASGRELFTLRGHTDAVRHAAWSGDGARILTASGDGTARVWDAASGRELLTLNGHSGPVRHATWSGDGAHILTASGDGTARVWDAASGRELLTLSGHTGFVWHAAWSGDGARILTASEDGTARVWDAASGRELFTLSGHTGAVLHATWSGDGARILTASEDGTARVWDAASGRELFTLSGHAGWIRHATWSGDGAHILTASGDGTARVWDAASGRELLTLSGHTGFVWHAAWSGDGARILTASEDGTAGVWKLIIEEPDQLSLVGHQAAVWQAVFDPSGQWVASAGQDGVARVWDAKTGELVAELAGHGSEVAEDQDRCPGCIQAIAFSPSGDWVLTAGWDGTARIWDARSGEELKKLVGHDGELFDAVFNPAGTIVATAGQDRTVRLWDADTGKVLFVLEASNIANQINFSRDGSLLVGAGGDGNAWLWEAVTGEARAKLEGEGSALTRAAFSPDGQRVAAVDWDGAGFVWNVATGERVVTLVGHTGTILELAYSPYGDMIATAGEDGTARLWDAETGQQRFVLRGHELTVWSAAFRPDGRQVATGGADGTVRLWNAQTGDPEGVLPDAVGSQLLVNWEVDRNTGVVSAPGPIRWVAYVEYSPSGDRVVAANTGGSVDIYVADTDMLLEIAQSQVTRELTCQERAQFLYEDLDCGP